MELTAFIQSELDRLNQTTTRVLDGLTREEISWQPNSQANSIGYLLFHVARSEDSFVMGRMQGKPAVWDTGKWFEKMGLPQSETGAGFTEEQLKNFKVPDVSVMNAYAAAVRAQTIQYLKNAGPAEFDRTVTFGRLGEMTIGSLLGLMVLHAAQHTGEMSYIRGLKRGMNK